jgi:polyisoprenoid-binding protein YceI
LQPSKLYSVLLAAFLPVVVIFQGPAKPAPSAITIHVHKSGLFSAFGHEHTIAAPIARGQLDVEAKTVEIVVAAKEMKVTDSEVSEKDRAEIQATMLGQSVLDTDKFPEIRFHSSHVEDVGGKRYRVTGRLELHGVAKELSFEVSRSLEGAYYGTTKLKQTDFGIHPVSVAGGTIKVKDELEIEFHVRGGDFRSEAPKPGKGH